MGVSMYHVRRGVARKQRREDAESLVRQIGTVIDTISRCMGQKDIESTVPQQRKPQTVHAPVHFALGVLMGAFFVAN